MINDNQPGECATNLIQFMQDVRRDWALRGLRLSLARWEWDGPNAHQNVQRFKAAESAAAALPEFQGNIALVETDVRWDMEADVVFRKGWREHREAWENVGTNYSYHDVVGPALSGGRVLQLPALSILAGQVLIGFRHIANPTAGGIKE